MSTAEIERRVAADALPRLLAGALAERPVSLAEHLDRHGALEQRTGASAAAALVELVEASGLTGRGGGSFPVWRKLAAVAGARARPIVIANGAEGEPVSDKDKALLRHAPHLVLDGAALAAAALGATEAVVVVAEGAAAELRALKHALAERKGVDRVPLRVARVPDRFVAGEETALIRSLDGGPAKPTYEHRPFERGLRGAPTLVQNVETLAHLALVARFGAPWFRAQGTRAEPGTALVTLSGAVRRPGVYEVPLGVPLVDLLGWANGATEPLSAVLVGGYFGTWVAASEAERLRLANADLASVGASLGARAIVALPATACGIVESARIVRYLADESAGQCGPCVFGLDAIAAGLDRIAAGGQDAAAARVQLKRWLAQVRGRGACRHPDGAARLVESVLRVFHDEVDRHAAGRCLGTRRAPLPTGAPL